MLAKNKKSQVSLKLGVVSHLKPRPRAELKRKPQSKSKVKTLKTVTSSLNLSRRKLTESQPEKAKLTLFKSKSKAKKCTINLCTQTEVKLRSLNGNQLSLKTSMLFGESPGTTSDSAIPIKSKHQKHAQILSRLQRQIEYQKQLLRLKHSINSDNIQGLCRQLEIHNIPSSELQLSVQEYNPALCGHKGRDLFQDILNSILMCNKHWQTYLRKTFSKAQIMDFFQSMDSSQQGLIPIKTWTHQLGQLLQADLKTGDVFRVFERLEKGGTISLCLLMRELCYDYDF